MPCRGGLALPYSAGLPGPEPDCTGWTSGTAPGGVITVTARSVSGVQPKNQRKCSTRVGRTATRRRLLDEALPVCPWAGLRGHSWAGDRLAGDRLLPAPGAGRSLTGRPASGILAAGPAGRQPGAGVAVPAGSKSANGSARRQSERRNPRSTVRWRAGDTSTIWPAGSTRAKARPRLRGRR